MCPRRGNDPASGHPRAHQPPLGRGTSPPAWDGRLDAPGQRRRHLPSSAWTRRREVKQGKSGGSVGTTDQGKGKGRSVVRPMGTVAYRGKGQGKGKGRGEGRLGQGGRGRSKGGEKLMGTAAYGGKGSKGRAANGDRPVGAASCRRDHHTMASCQNPQPVAIHRCALGRGCQGPVQCSTASQSLPLRSIFGGAGLRQTVRKPQATPPPQPRISSAASLCRPSQCAAGQGPACRTSAICAAGARFRAAFQSVRRDQIQREAAVSAGACGDGHRAVQSVPSVRWTQGTGTTALCCSSWLDPERATPGGVGGGRSAVVMRAFGGSVCVRRSMVSVHGVVPIGPEP